MANTLTNLIPDIYVALDVVSRELVGMIPSVTLDPSVARAAVGQTVRSPVVTQGTGEDVAPGQLPPDTGDQTVGNEPIVIEKSRAYPFRWDGEQQLGLNNNGPGYLTIKQNQIAMALRGLTNEMESYIVAKAVLRSSRAYGTAGTTPLAAVTDVAQVLKILKDNGAPGSDLQLVINTAAGLNLRSIANLYKANEAGTDTMLRQGVLSDLYGLAIRETAGTAVHTKGTGSNTYQTNNVAGYAIGDTTIALDTGSGTVLAGDVVTFAGDTNKYVVKTALTGGVIVLNAPGLQQTLADNVVMTVGNNYTGNMAFHRSAIILATRAPAIPEEGDMADDAIMVTDPRTGMSFEVRMYRQYRRVRYEVCAAWGGAGIKPEHTATLLG